MASSQQPSRHAGSRRLPNRSLQDYEGIPRSDPVASQQRQNDESWVEIDSQPSSSSLSSIGDEIVTTGLRVGHASYPPRRRRLQRHYQQSHMPPTYIVAEPAGGASSQEEYEETESEEDHIMTTSSTENMPERPSLLSLPRSQTAVGPSPGSGSSNDDDDDDDDENATALGRPSPSQGFRPQPNAFSHPPSQLSHRGHSASPAVPQYNPNPRPSLSQRSHTSSHSCQPDFMSPSYQADNDAALRASLTTLLSCAAAARGLPRKEDNKAALSSGGPVLGAGPTKPPPMELRLVPESDLMAEEPAHRPAASAPPKAPTRTRQPPTSRAASNSSAQSAPTSASLGEEKAKRAAPGQSKSQRATKKKRTSASADSETTTFISPTLLTWVVSAGVVVLVSVVGFGAGFVIGREAGRQEALSSGLVGGGGGAGANASSCGREAIRSTGGGTLRRFRWGAAVGRSVAA